MPHPRLAPRDQRVIDQLPEEQSSGQLAARVIVAIAR